MAFFRGEYAPLSSAHSGCAQSGSSRYSVRGKEMNRLISALDAASRTRMSPASLLHRSSAFRPLQVRGREKNLDLMNGADKPHPSGLAEVSQELPYLVRCPGIQPAHERGAL